MNTLTPEDRLRLLRFACSFAWADLRVSPEERTFILDLVRRIDLSAQEKAQVDAWLAHPPAADDLDPLEIPLEHRKLFVETAIQTIRADKKLALEEMESFALFETILYAPEEGDGGEE